MKNYFFQLTIILFIGLNLQAQQSPNVSLYRHHFNMFNPAVSGIKPAPFLNMSFRSQWQGADGAPETQVVSFATPTKRENVGLGINLLHDKTFIEKQTQFFGSFSYLVQFNRELKLYLGLQAGVNGYSVNAAGLEVWDEGKRISDPFLLSFSKLNPNFGVGAYLKDSNFYVSLSAPKILTTKRFKDDNGLVTTASDRVHYFLSAGFYQRLNNDFRLIPSFLFRYTNYAPPLLTINTSLSYKETIDFGIEYSFQSGFGSTLLVDTGSTFSFGYAYVSSLHGAINRFSKGTHEVVIQIKLGKDIVPTKQVSNESTSRFKRSKKERKIGTQNKN